MDPQPNQKGIIDREKMMTLLTCAACGRRFLLGEPVVLACGAWEGPPTWIHEEEAVFDPEIGAYVELSCHQGSRVTVSETKPDKEVS
jgi:hypothetical protein